MINPLLKDWKHVDICSVILVLEISAILLTLFNVVGKSWS